MPMLSEMTPSRSTVVAVALVALASLANWSVGRLTATAATADVAPGPVDPRGFRVKLVDGDTGAAVRYDACRPLHYVINPALATPGGIRDIRRAFELTGEASGLRFVYDGTTDEPYDPDRASYQPERYGERWAPILISWTNEPLTDVVAGAEGTRPIAAAGSRFEVNAHGAPVFVTGHAVFDSSWTEIPAGFGGQTWGQAMLHELGHVLGLDHVDDPASVMNPVIGLRAANWGGGDRAGLWSQGIGTPCAQSPDTP